MNGMATVHNRHVPNLCKCGHDRKVHDITIPTGQNICYSCAPISTGSNANNHFFEGIMQADAFPQGGTVSGGVIRASWFLQMRPYNYYQAGGFGSSGLVKQAIATLAIAGSTSFGINLAQYGGMSGIQVGMTFMLNFPNAPQQQSQYQVIGISGSTITIKPALFYAITNAPAQLLFFGGFQGSTMGPNLPGNNQRGG